VKEHKDFLGEIFLNILFLWHAISKIKFIGHWNAELAMLLMYTSKSRWWPKLLPKTNWIENLTLDSYMSFASHPSILIKCFVNPTITGFSWNWSIINVLLFL
jgi:hypothetical protein